MSYIIDGHNLIPKIRGLSLDQMDDEAHLIQLLMKFCQLKKAHAVVFFDKAALGQQRKSNHGAVSAIFVSDRRKADDAIHDYLVVHRREARNLIVVSSDREVQRDAHSFHAVVLSTDDFSEQLSKSLSPMNQVSGEQEVKPLTPEEVDEWEKLFTRHNK
jgi:predicted RNA-binding protein with PIN domain